MAQTKPHTLADARAHEAAGDFASADRIYAALYDQKAPDPALMMAWAKLRRRVNDLDNATKMFNIAGQAGAGAAAAIELASIAIDQGRPKDAVPLLQRIAQATGRTPALDFQAARCEAAFGNPQRAAQICRDVIKADPRHGEARLLHGRTLVASGQPLEAVGAYEALLAREPDNLLAMSDLAYLFGSLRRFDDSLALYDKIERRGYDIARELSQIALGMMHMAEWRQRDALAARLAARMAAPAPCLTEAYAFLAGEDDPVLHRQVGEHFASAIREFGTSREAPPARPVGPAERRLRIGYLSGDFSQHATSLLMAGIIEAHDRSRFEVFAYDYSPDDKSPTRARILGAFEHVALLGNEGPAASARRIADDGIDILIDLKGYTERTRSEIMALRPAPIQVNFLGYVGTQAGNWIDYVIADRHVLPDEEQVNWSEKPVWMPHSYYPNDRKRPLPVPDTDRAAHHLPAEGVVFACFNNPFKISPQIFAVWMNILREIPGSVLWLYGNNDFVEANLRREAEQAGIDPARLVFARPATLEQHIARHGVADIFLDTLPYGAHTTGADALWAGLPMISCTGRSWPSRVGASLLHAVGLPELAVSTLPEYQALAIALANDAPRRAALRAQLIAARETAPLFDAEAFARGLERAFTVMAERARAGDAPSKIEV